MNAGYTNWAAGQAEQMRDRVMNETDPAKRGALTDDDGDEGASASERVGRASQQSLAIKNAWKWRFPTAPRPPGCRLLKTST